jgi:hypothetical protein
MLFLYLGIMFSHYVNKFKFNCFINVYNYIIKDNLKAIFAKERITNDREVHIVF